MGSRIEIVPATQDMLSALISLEETCFSAPWTRKMMEAELTGNQFARFLVARDAAGTIVAYHCFWIVFEELRLMNLAVSESMRRKGIGRALVTEALRMGLEQAATRAILEVRASNQAACALYGQLGFVPISTRPKYYTQPVEDAVLMQMDPLVVSSPRSFSQGGSVSAH